MVNPFLNKDSCSRSIVDLSRFSSYPKLPGTLSKAFIAINLFKKTPIKDDEAKVFEFTHLMRVMQMPHYKDVFKYFQESLTKPCSILVKQLNLSIDHKGFIRSKGRLTKCEYLNEDAVNSALCHHSDKLTNLLMLNAHSIVKHLGTDATMNCLRQGCI